MFAVAGATEDLGGAEQRVLRAEHTVYVRARLEEQVVFDSRTGEHRPWSPTYRNKHMTALHQVIKIAWQLGRVTAEECDRAVGVRPFEGVRLPAEEQLTPAAGATGIRRKRAAGRHNRRSALSQRFVRSGATDLERAGGLSDRLAVGDFHGAGEPADSGYR